jgi:hypothetical protein
MNLIWIYNTDLALSIVMPIVLAVCHVDNENIAMNEETNMQYIVLLR